MPTTYYIYERATGKYAGSGLTPIDDETHTYTTTPVPPADPPEPVAYYDDATDTWTWVTPT